MGTQIFLGKPPANIEQWIRDHYAPPTPTPTPPNGKVWFKTSASQVDWSEEDANISDGIFYGFDSQYNAVEVVIPSKDSNGNGVTSIGSSVFDSCDRLASVTIPDSVTSIGDWAFAYCDGLASVTIPDSVTSIGEEAFYYCSSLTSVTIPDSVTSIGNSAFYQCSNLTSITFSGKTKATVQGMDNYSWDIPSGCVLHCTDGDITI